MQNPKGVRVLAMRPLKIGHAGLERAARRGARASDARRCGRVAMCSDSIRVGRRVGSAEGSASAEGLSRAVCGVGDGGWWGVEASGAQRAANDGGAERWRDGARDGVARARCGCRCDCPEAGASGPGTLGAARIQKGEWQRVERS
eukprot:scaffold3676_cov108-Isochrysis_galbana.AAC.1